MSKLILHIGTHKTATTMIQGKFWTFAPLLAERGIVYPRLNDIHGHHGLTAPWSPVGEVDPDFLLPEGAEAGFARIARDHAGGNQAVILSSEEFSRSGPNGGVNYGELRRYLDAFDEIQVICLLRPQWQFIQSVYVELSKAMSPPPLRKLIETAKKKGVFAGLWADYNLLLDRLEAAFGPENVTLQDFETCRAGPGGVVGSLLRLLGLDPQEEALVELMAGTANVSPPGLACWIANQVAEPRVAPPWLVQAASELLRQEYGGVFSSCLFSRAELNDLATHFQPLNAELARRRQPWQPGFALSPDRPQGPTLFRDELSTAFWVRMARTGFETSLTL